jgi:predicted phage tail protein
MDTNEVRTIKLSGILARKFGHVHKFAVKSPAEAVRALSVMVPGFEKFLMESSDKGINFAVMVGPKNIGEQELRNPSGDSEIRFVPILAGSKNQGIVQVVLGVVLIIAGIFVTGMSFGSAAPVGAAMIGAGIGMVVGGIMQLLFPVPKQKSSERPDNGSSYLFNGPANVQAQGNPVPILYGELWVGSAVISAGIDVDDGYVPRSTYDTGEGAGGGLSLIGDVRDQVSSGFSRAA